MKLTLLSAALWAVLLVSGCRTPGSKPLDMSVAGHDAAAARAEADAQRHGELSEVAPRRASPCLTGPGIAYDSPCWLSEGESPADMHHWAQTRSARAAADHRAASKALRDAEAAACVGIAVWDRDVSPFAHTADLDSVEPVEEGGETRGARLTFKGTPGLTAAYLRRLVDCHLARNAAMGFLLPEMAFCPLAVKGAQAEVAGADGALSVTLRGNGRAAEEILRRARSLLATGHGDHSGDH